MIGRKMRWALLLLVAVPLGLQAYSLDVAKPDANGKLPVSSHPSKMAVLVDTTADISVSRRLAIVTAGKFATEQIRELGLFDEVIDADEAEQRIIREGLGDKVLSLRDAVGQYLYAKNKQPFLLISSGRETRKSKNKAGWLLGDEYEQFVKLRVIDPLKAKVLFEVEIEEDLRWKGVSEKNTYYPLLNQLVDWVRKNTPDSAPDPATVPEAESMPATETSARINGAGINGAGDTSRLTNREQSFRLA